MHRLTGTVQHYAWGSPTELPRVLGAEPDGRPWAELWYGAHPSAPSRLDDGRALDAAIAADPTYWLGEAVHRRHGARLPFLVKLLAAGQPLSLQAHPSAAQAAEGFAREDAAGVPIDSPRRLYRDDQPKPEVLVALTPFDALCGFRPLDATVELLRALARAGARGLKPYADLLADPGADPAATLAYTVGTLLTMAPGDQRHLVAETAAAAEGLDGPWALSAGWTSTLAGLHPADAGVVVALLLNCVRLQPGQAVFLAAGNLHAYLGGTGVEVMANSDNVLRGGLTPKHVDVPELLRVVDFHPLVDPVLDPVVDEPELRYATPAPEFRVSVVPPTGDGRRRHVVDGPEIVLCTDGAFDALDPGRAAVVAAAEGEWSLSGDGTVFVVGVGDA